MDDFLTTAAPTVFAVIVTGLILALVVHKAVRP